MARTSVKVQVTNAAIVRYMNDPTEGPYQYVWRKTRAVGAAIYLETPVKTGRLRRSVSVEGVSATAHGPVGAVKVGYRGSPLGYILYGTTPHLIEARRRRALRFEVGGHTVFARWVHHPGTVPNDFVSRGLVAGFRTG